ncbi:MAG: efflux RND transporter periplasmic adaptor subunit [Bacteroidota bacterium]|nr:efflux RND transporter periplasmic adaptor subunit [Candidatus Kapabacteria bacterium]MDW8075083.1 efflux RND transporter periplasmic adaptor subunit [Bacteroidota bacterium]
MKQLLRWTAIVLLLLVSCSQRESTSPAHHLTRKRTAVLQIENDTIVVLAPEQARQFATTTVRTDSIGLMLRVAGRVVAKAVLSADSSIPPLIVFESNDAAQRYTEYLKARANFEHSTTQLARIRDMAAHQAASGKDVLEAVTEHRIQQAVLLDAESELRQSGLRPELLERMSQGSILIACDVPEAFLPYVQLGEQAYMSFAAAPTAELVGRVIELADAVDPTTRTVRVFMILPQAPAVIRPGMFATVRLLKRRVNAAIVPREAVVVAEGQPYVFVQRDSSTFVRRPVTLAGDTGKEFQITEGLRAGERVVISRTMLLKGLSFGY